MCGFVGSRNAEEAIAIASKMKERGTIAWSLSIINLNSFTTCSSFQDQKEFDAARAQDAVTVWAGATDDDIDPYFIFHLLSPTGEGIHYHPAVASKATEFRLWHNGAMDPVEHKKRGGGWDTQLFVDDIFELGPVKASEAFQGSFSILYLQVRKGLYAARNRISPLFRYKETFCSILYKDTFKAVEPGQFFPIGPVQTVYPKFENTYNPFGV